MYSFNSWDGIFRECSFAMEEILFDPQTSGGLLVSMQKEDAPAALAELKELGLPCGIIGEITDRGTRAVIVK